MFFVVRTYGPVTQSIFLKAMGIEARHQVSKIVPYTLLLQSDTFGSLFRLVLFVFQFVLSGLVRISNC